MKNYSAGTVSFEVVVLPSGLCVVAVASPEEASPEAVFVMTPLPGDNTHILSI